MNTKLDDAIGKVLCAHHEITHTYEIPVNSTHKLKDHKDIIYKINEYLFVGGLWNPEMMEHEKVRDLLMEIRDLLKEDEQKKKDVQRVKDFLAQRKRNMLRNW